MEVNGKTRYGRICKLLEQIVGETIPLIKLQRRVMIEIGSSPSVIKESIQLMIDLDLIREKSNMIFKILRCEAEL